MRTEYTVKPENEEQFTIIDTQAAEAYSRLGIEVTAETRK